MPLFLPADVHEKRTPAPPAYHTQFVSTYWTPPTTFPSPQVVAVGPVPINMRAMPGYPVQGHSGLRAQPPMPLPSAQDPVSTHHLGAYGGLTRSIVADATESLSNSSGYTSDLPPASTPSPPPETSTDLQEPLLQSSATQLPDPAMKKPPEPPSTQPAEVPKAQKDTLISGPDVPLVDIDLDALIKSHNDIFKMPTQVKEPDKSGVDIKSLIDSAKQSLIMLGSWFRSVPTFMQLPQADRVKCLRACWVDQATLNLVFRSFVQTPEEGLVLHSGIKMAKGHSINHSLASYSAGRLMGEVMSVFKDLALDYKEFILIRLLVLLNPGV